MTIALWVLQFVTGDEENSYARTENHCCTGLHSSRFDDDGGEPHLDFLRALGGVGACAGFDGGSGP